MTTEELREHLWEKANEHSDEDLERLNHLFTISTRYFIEYLQNKGDTNESN